MLFRAILQERRARRETKQAREKKSYSEGKGGNFSLGLARNKVDVVVIECCASEHGAVRVEGRTGDGRRAVVVKEARVRLEGGEVCAINVVGLDFVAVCAPIEKGLVI
jgi:hypothetical protein